MSRILHFIGSVDLTTGHIPHVWRNRMGRVPSFPSSCKVSPENPWHLPSLCSSTPLEAVPQTLSLRQSGPTLNYAHIKKIFLIFNLNILYIKPENEVNFCSSFSQWTWGIIDCRFCSSVWNAETCTGTCYSFPWSSGFWIKAQFFKAILFRSHVVISVLWPLSNLHVSCKTYSSLV